DAAADEQVSQPGGNVIVIVSHKRILSRSKAPRLCGVILNVRFQVLTITNRAEATQEDGPVRWGMVLGPKDRQLIAPSVRAGKASASLPEARRADTNRG